MTALVFVETCRLWEAAEAEDILAHQKIECAGKCLGAVFILGLHIYVLYSRICYLSTYCPLIPIQSITHPVGLRGTRMQI